MGAAFSTKDCMLRGRYQNKKANGQKLIANN